MDRKIIDACLELLAEGGRVGITRERIAARAGVSLPAVTRRYASVDDIILAIASTPYHESMEIEGVSSLREYLVAALGRGVEAMAEDHTIGRSAIELLSAAAGHPGIAAALRDSLARHRRQGLWWIERAKATGEVAPDLDGELLLDLLSGAAYYRLLWRGEVLPGDEVEGVVDLLLAGAAGPRSGSAV